MEELFVTLKMLDVKYHICSDSVVIITIRLNKEVIFSIIDYLNLYNFIWKYSIGHFYKIGISDPIEDNEDISGITIYFKKDVV